MVYGYCRISTATQNIERQVRNILKLDSNAVIYKEVFTGTKVQGRKEFNKLLKVAKADDTIIFDSVSRMSRNAEQGIDLYMELYSKGINLVFIKEPYINTDVYRQESKPKIQLQGTDEDILFEAINRYSMRLAERQIKVAFDQAEKEVTDLQQRTREGLETARRNGKQIGRATGSKVETKKGNYAKEIIRKHLGKLKDSEIMLLAKVSKATYYKYKKEIVAELEAE